ncbi:probable E3 ubiquitin-protein ligase ARI2 isoform X1 [Tanacetum coccineum]
MVSKYTLLWKTIQIKDDDIYHEVECVCGKEFYFSCCSEPHSPCSMRMWELWKDKCKEPLQSITWVIKFYNRFVANRESHVFEVRMKKKLKEVVDSPVDYDWTIDAATIFLDSRALDQINELKVQIIDFSSLINDLCKQMYEFIDNELLQHQDGRHVHIIAPYRSNGAEKVVELDQ